jgi:tetratricopeptide (TPR) repeat protein
MNSEPVVYTATMAKVYTSQGHFAQAIAIYRRLLQENPDRADLKAALALSEKQLQEQEKTRKQDLAQRFSEWMGLLRKYNFLRKLSRVKGNWGAHGD